MSHPPLPPGTLYTADGSLHAPAGAPGPARATALDAWGNAALGFGGVNDPMMQTGIVRRHELGQALLDELYARKGLARKIVDLVVEDEFRGWIKLNGVSEDPEVLKALADEVYRLGLRRACVAARKWARLYGGGGIVVRVEGDERPGVLVTPLDARKIVRITALVDADRHDLLPEGGSVTRFDWYSWTTPENTVVRIHKSRVVRFEGLALPRRMRQDNWGWGQSVIDLVWEELSRCGLTDAGIGRLTAEFVKTILTVPDLLTQLSAQGSGAVEARYALLRLHQSIHKMTLLDSQEKMDHTGVPATGLADLVDLIRISVAAVSDYPVVRLFGVSPGGLNATGDTDEAFYHDRVAMNREEYDRPPLERLLDLVMSAKRWGPEAGAVVNPLGAPPPGWSLEFPPVKRPSAKELAEIRLLTSQADAMDIQAQILDPVAVAATRYGSGEYDPGCVAIDLDDYAPMAPPEEPEGPEDPEEPEEPEEPDESAEVADPTETQDADTYTPPQGAAEAARRALEAREQEPPSNRAMTPVGLARAQQLAKREPVSLETVERMVDFFSRHRGTRPDAEPEKGWSKWRQAWMGWGGVAGARWAYRIAIAQEETERGKASLRETLADIERIGDG